VTVSTPSAPASEESLFAHALRVMGPAKLHAQLASMRLRDLAPGELPPDYEHATLLDVVDHVWEWHARPGQLAPSGDWNVWGIVTGRGWGKSRCASQWVVGTAEETGAQVSAGTLGREAAKILVVAPTSADLRDVCVEGDGGILRSCPPWLGADYEPSKRRITFGNGVEVVLISSDEPDRVRGVQGVAAWLDEAAVYPKLAEVFSNVRFATRLGNRPRIVLTTTPRRRRELRDILAAPGTVITRGRTRENAGNLAPGVVDALEASFGGSRLGRQELDGELLTDVPGALWNMDLIDTARVAMVPELKRVVIGVDPSGGSRASNDECGIVAAGIGKCRCKGTEENHAFVLADASGRFSPEGWARAAVNLYQRFQGDRVVAEQNFGGAMVEATLRQVAPEVSYRGVTASRGKVIRAEPIAAAYEMGKVHHVGTHARLEDQMCEWSPMTDTYSPDRVDALVWALTDLKIGSGGEPVFPTGWRTPPRRI
jgi:phage terminase large subunit-like protein